MLFAIEYYGLLVDALFCLMDESLEMILGDACENLFGLNTSNQFEYMCSQAPLKPNTFEAFLSWTTSTWTL